MKKNFMRGRLLIKGFIGTWRKRFREHVERVLTSGYVPKSSRPLQLVARFIARIWLFIQIGRVKIIGAENLTPNGRVIFCPNHSSMFDAIVIFAIMRRFPKYMTAYEEMQGLWGLKAAAMAAFGCFAVDRSKGKSVIEPAINVVVEGSPLVIFPEGKISNSGTYLPFKKGSALIAIGACEKLQHLEKVGVVPIHICYGKRDEKTAGASYGAMGFKWRGGVVITVGEPIWIHDLNPLTPERVTQEIREKITTRACPTTSLPDDTQ